MRVMLFTLFTVVFVGTGRLSAGEDFVQAQARLLRAWQLIDQNQYLSDEAAREIRATGTNALPILISMLKTQEPQNHRTNSNRALFGFRALGATAKPAIPEIISLLGHQDYGDNAVLALAAIGKDAVPSLIVCLTNKNPRVRASAAVALNRLWQFAELAAPQLIENLRDDNIDVVMATMRSLGGIVKEPTPVLPILIEYVGHTNETVQRVAMEALLGYREKAKSASPAVIRAMSDKNPLVRKQAKAVLPYIDREAAKRLISDAVDLSEATDCPTILQTLDGAKQMWALGNRKGQDAVPKDTDLFGFDKLILAKPRCPQGGEYTIGAVGERTRCSVPSHKY
jgi:HEAT repeat protein